MSQIFENKRQQEIDAYLDGKMSEEEVIAFEEKLAKDVELKEDVLLQESLHQSFREDDWSEIPSDTNDKELQAIRSTLRSDDVTKISATIKNVGTEYRTKELHTDKKRNTRFYMRVAIAAVVIIVFALPFVVQLNTTNQYDQYADWENLPSLRTKGDTQTKIIKGESLYLSENYKETIHYFENNIPIQDPYYSYALIYVGASYFHTGDMQQAHQTYDTLIAQNTLQSSYGYWYKLLLYLKSDDTQKVNGMLDRILSDSNNYNYEKAKKIQENLNKE